MVRDGLDVSGDGCNGGSAVHIEFRSVPDRDPAGSVILPSSGELVSATTMSPSTTPHREPPLLGAHTRLQDTTGPWSSTPAGPTRPGTSPRCSANHDPLSERGPFESPQSSPKRRTPRPEGRGVLSYCGLGRLRPRHPGGGGHSRERHHRWQPHRQPSELRRWWCYRNHRQC